MPNATFIIIMAAAEKTEHAHGLDPPEVEGSSCVRLCLGRTFAAQPDESEAGKPGPPSSHDEMIKPRRHRYALELQIVLQLYCREIIIIITHVVGRKKES